MNRLITGSEANLCRFALKLKKEGVLDKVEKVCKSIIDGYINYNLSDYVYTYSYIRSMHYWSEF